MNCKDDRRDPLALPDLYCQHGRGLFGIVSPIQMIKGPLNDVFFHCRLWDFLEVLEDERTTEYTIIVLEDTDDTDSD